MFLNFGSFALNWGVFRTEDYCTYLDVQNDICNCETCYIFQTFVTDAQTTDSASSAFAIYSGIKTNHWTFGYDSSVIKSNATHQAKEYDTIYKWAQVSF